MPSCRVPLATYRLQFNPQFGFRDAKELVDYLARLGISDAYASPLFRAGEFSLHGYDVVDHTCVSPDFGTEDDFRDFAAELAAHEMGLLMDVVPNHMGINDPANRLWQDVLENGESSPYAKFFDVDWNPPKEELKHRVLLPFLGDQYGKVLESQELKVAFADGIFLLTYYDRRFPLNPRSWARILELVQHNLVGRLETTDPQWTDLESITLSLRNLPDLTDQDPEKVHQRQLEREVAPRRLSQLLESSPVIREALDAAIDEFNGAPGDPRSFDRLEALLAEQAYRLSFWRVASDEINYRRFFDINELAAIRVEDPAVFRTTHELVFRFAAEGWVTGLRIDHPDGLQDPERYFADLQDEYLRAIGREDLAALPPAERPEPLAIYVVAEKILASDEALPESWAVSGTTGYDYLNLANGVFVERSAAAAMRSAYARFTGVFDRFRDVAYESKKTILEVSMSSELHVLARRLDRISEAHRWSRDFTHSSLRRALREVIACFPVYRSYIRPGAEKVEGDDRRRITAALRLAKRRNPELNASIFDFIGSVLLLEHPPHLDETQRDERLEFVLRFQQLTGPVIAKGLEDTAFYRDFPLLSLTEVGGDPEAFGASLEQFHRKNAERLARWPHTMLASSTHDTKRSEDMRARLNVLSECSEEWEAAILRWRSMNAPHKTELDGNETPSGNEEYLLYQTLVGAWPLEPMDDRRHEAFTARIQQFMLKALREAKLNTSWTSPNEEYEAAVRAFVDAALSPEEQNEFLRDLAAFQAPLAVHGAHNGLSQTLLKMCVPGMPDFYQGMELWDFSLVDPDNRRPVDFRLRRAYLEELEARAGGDLRTLTADLQEHWRDGRIKLYVTFQTLNFRRQHAALFQQGDYVPLEAEGPLADRLCAFARVQGDDMALVVVPRCTLHVQQLDRPAWKEGVWAETSLRLPWPARRWRNLFTGAIHEAEDAGADVSRLSVEQAFGLFPAALLCRS
ncbi:MAG TPA: malto-oligosyltrehalose synthase [Pirellulales bacterium]|nr:malto-oligosyltrehalose synthase [Pirellulales bacterium]